MWKLLTFLRLVSHGVFANGWSLGIFISGNERRTELFEFTFQLKNLCFEVLSTFFLLFKLFPHALKTGESPQRDIFFNVTHRWVSASTM